MAEDTNIQPEEVEDLTLAYEPGTCEILGVFSDHIHVKSIDDESVLIIPIKEHLRMLKIWLKGKQDYCERWNEYCGVGGYCSAEKYEKGKSEIILHEYSQCDGDYRKVPYPVYIVSKFVSVCDFEHG